ncbi:MAG TPA: hypothetical protein PKY56_10215 [Candidatus Kapabacteria bacterium]|nr:hypothetical protein [Candidatus Kapabacteria bacterium]HPO63846.1 hypothetical protein [Candidatus Kapabacteria bacterium]
MGKYDIKRYNFDTKKTIDIYKKEEPKSKYSKKDITNLALIALRRNNLNYSRAYENFKEKILELNNKVRSQPTKKVVNVVRYWLSEIT